MAVVFMLGRIGRTCYLSLGAKPSSFAASDEFNIWREKLDELRIDNFVFDGPGFLESDIDPDGNSLTKRILDAQAAVL